MNDTLPPDIEHANQGATITIFAPIKVAMVIARIPWILFLESLLSATVLSVIGLVVGKFSIAVENDRWKSRQTLIANRDMQRTMLMDNQILYPLPHNHATETENDSGNGNLDCCIFW